MSSITNSANYGFYQLSNSGGGQSNGATAQTNVTQSLVQALSVNNAAGTSGSNDAYLLSLSPAAQQYLSATGSTSGSGDALLSALKGTSSSSSALPGVQNNFALSTKQQQDITAILTKYKDAPYDQDTFDNIQKDLNAAGLGTATLSMLDKAKSFNPAIMLINALNGNSSNNLDGGVASNAEEQAKSSSYMQNIISQWKTISGNSGNDNAESKASATAVAPIGSSSGA